MTTVQGLNDSGNQVVSIPLADGTRVSLTLYFRPQQSAWFFDVVYNAFTCLGRRMVCSPNLLRQFRNIVPFGLAVFTVGNVEPNTQTAFVDGTASLVLLDSTDVSSVETTLFPGL